MSRPTVPVINRIVLAFDFDETLAPSTYPKVLLQVRDHMGKTPLARTHPSNRA